jgi:hypothetical protein
MLKQRNIDVVIAFVMSREPERCEGSGCGLFLRNCSEFRLKEPTELSESQRTFWRCWLNSIPDTF